MVQSIDNFNPYYSKEIKKENIRWVERKTLIENKNFELVQGSISKIRDLEKLPKPPEKYFI